MRFSTAAIFSLALASKAAFACDPGFRTVADYARGSIANHAVFIGKVKSVREQQFKDVVTQDIEMEVVRWLSGARAGPIVNVRGIKEVRVYVPCIGPNFSVQTGQHWLVFGQSHDGAINPDVYLSRLAPDGRAEPALVRQFSRKRKPTG